MLVRSWNLFHGNTVPPQRRAFLDEMLALATADDPDVLCVQEVPAWALDRFAVGDVAAPPKAGTLLGRALTALNHGLLRSAVAGQGNAIWVPPRLRVVALHVLTLNPRDVRRQLRLPRDERRAWARERRIVQAARLETGSGTLVVANTHCTSYAGDPRLAEVELARAARFAADVARADERLVLAGDFNLGPDAAAVRALAEEGFSAPGPGIDHILVRGAPAGALRVWPEERRRRTDGTLLSDHAPVELELG